MHYLARRQEELLTPLAVTLNEAAGTEGVHRWSLILPSSARVSFLTYQTVIGVRYLELVKYQDGEHRFGRFLTELSAKRGGFLPILWDAPKSDTYAVQDIGMVVDHLRGLYRFTNDPEETLAVLHNKNRLVHAFCRSGWIQDTEGMVLSRSVTSCAGMTAKVTIIAQTRIGFLSGPRRFAGGEGAEDAYEVQCEEAAARATVALTRAKELCVILGPLDMLGLIGAATVIGSLMYGVGLCWQQDLEFHYQHKELGGDMDDEQMVQQLKAAGPCAELPPLALAEVVHLIDEEFQVRRLHLIIVDLWRQKWLPGQTICLLRNSMRAVTAGPRTLNTTPIRLSASGGRRQHQVRFTYGYALDGSTYPCYCVYPERGEDHSFQLLDSATGYIMAISRAESMKPLGVAHFYHAFSVNQDCEDGPNFREAALHAFDLPDAAITEDKQVIMPWANRILPAARFARNIPAEEEDTASVISVASSGTTAQKRATETDSDASQPSEDDDQADAATVVEVPTDEDESEPESEEEYELSEKEQRLLHEAYDTYMLRLDNSGRKRDRARQLAAEHHLQMLAMSAKWWKSSLTSN